MTSRKTSHAPIHVVGVFCLLLLAYHLIFRDYFPLPNGRMGHDYVLTLGGLLDGFLWFRNNGFVTPPWFTPSFCGGQPFFADPQSIFYSLPQFLTFITDPIQAVYAALLIFAGIGFWGMYLFARSNLGLDRVTATVTAGIFMFNGFYAHRMIVGHYGYQPFMLIPLIAYLLLRHPEKSLRSLEGLGLALGAGLSVAYCFHAGLTTLMVPAALAVVTLACLANIAHPRAGTVSFLSRGGIAGLLAIGLCASKLNANLSLMGNFARDYYPLPGIDNIGDLLTFVFQSLFYSSEHTYQTVTPLWKNMQWAAMPHELAFGLTPAPLLALLLGAGAYALARQKSGTPSVQRKIGLAWPLLGSILLLPLSMLYYTPEWNKFLKQIPLIGSTTSPYRWLIIYLPILAATAGLAIRAAGKYRFALAVLTLVSIPLLNALESRDYYQQQNFDPTPMVRFYEEVAQGKQTPIIRQISDPRYTDGQPTSDNEAFLLGHSALRCYNPLYGYRQEHLQTAPLAAGPVGTTTTAHSLNLHNPACQVFPAENHCRPGDAFDIEQKAALEAFASYRPYDFAKSTRQLVADALTHAALGCIALFLLWAIARRLRSLRGKSPGSSLRHLTQTLASAPSYQLGALLFLTWLWVFAATRWLPVNGLAAGDLAMIQHTFVTWPGFFQPEPRERAAYLLAITLFPALSMLLTAWLIRHQKCRSTSMSEQNGISALLGTWSFFLLLGTILLASREAPFGQTFGFSDYTIVRALFESGRPFLLFLVFFAAAWLAFREGSGGLPAVDTRFRNYLNRACDLAAIGIVVGISARLSFIPEDTGALAWAPDLIHMSPIFEAAGTAYLSSATAGANMVSQYGGLVEFARPLLWLMNGDPLALLWFAFLALAIAGLTQWLAVRKVSGSPLVALLTSGAVFYFTSIKFQSFVCFQCGNFRWLWPSIFLCLAAFASTGTKLRILPYFLFPIAIYWNPETGLAATAAWIGWSIIVHGQAWLSGNSPSGVLYPWLKKISMATIGVCLGILAVSTYTYLKSGLLPNPELMSRFAKDFYLYGFYMLPMPGLHLWNLYAVTSAGLLLAGIRHYAQPEHERNGATGSLGFVTYASLLFALLYSYYQGRSYYGNLLIVSYPLWLAIAALSGRSRMGNTALRENLSQQPLKYLGLLLICFGFAASLTTNFNLPSMQNPLLKKASQEKTELRDWVSETSQGRTPLFISFSAWRMQLIAGTAPGPEITPLAALLRRDQLDRYITALGNRQYALYYDPTNDIYFPIEQTFWAQELKSSIQRIAPQGLARLPRFSNGQGELILLNPL